MEVPTQRTPVTFVCALISQHQPHSPPAGYVVGTSVSVATQPVTKATPVNGTPYNSHLAGPVLSTNNVGDTDGPVVGGEKPVPRGSMDTFQFNSGSPGPFPVAGLIWSGPKRLSLQVRLKNSPGQLLPSLLLTDAS
ncbi:hypothetical protein ACRALDRAFT_209999 [Sodiomyces alcalophilus JCM 7366]|uniref:uncharacterized protein n=1 Tax=Sodiomyces alcalophilus JCM 7366 TaxID=591952 RepID=UPI0039B36BE4